MACAESEFPFQRVGSELEQPDNSQALLTGEIRRLSLIAQIAVELGHQPAKPVRRHLGEHHVAAARAYRAVTGLSGQSVVAVRATHVEQKSS